MSSTRLTCHCLCAHAALSLALCPITFLDCAEKARRVRVRGRPRCYEYLQSGFWVSSPK